MTLSEYLIEAVAKRSSGKYFDFENLDIRSTSYNELVTALTNSNIPHIPEMYDMIIPSLIGINKNSDAMKELIKAGKGKHFMWSLDPGPKTRYRYLYFYYIESNSIASVWKLTYGDAGPIICQRTNLPSGKTDSKNFNWNINIISDMIKTVAK